jgi:hypothetical protein
MMAKNQMVRSKGDSTVKNFKSSSFLAVLLILIAGHLIFSVPAQAYDYDNFTTPGINPSLWSDRGPTSGLFSQPGDGYLYFNDSTGGHSQALRSLSRQTAPFFVAMKFDDFKAENTAPIQFGGSGPVLSISDSINSVSIYEFIDQVANPPQGFRVKTVINGVTTGSPIISSSTTSGWLGIGYNGTKATFWYNDGSGWHQMIIDQSDNTSINPNFTSNPFFFIKGADDYGASLSFKVDQVQLNPTPLPPRSGLVGSPLLNLLLGE